MSFKAGNPKRVLAIDPTPRGFGFVVLEGLTSVIDWGVKSTKTSKQKATLAKVTELIRHYQPEMIVLEAVGGKGSRRCKRIQDLITSIRSLAQVRNVRSSSFSPAQVKRIFLTFGAATKHQIAHAVAQQLPELASRVPRYRKPWMSEDYGMAIFDAAALALTYFYSRQVTGRERRK